MLHTCTSSLAPLVTASCLHVCTRSRVTQAGVAPVFEPGQGLLTNRCEAARSLRSVLEAATPTNPRGPTPDPRGVTPALHIHPLSVTHEALVCRSSRKLAGAAGSWQAFLMAAASIVL